MTAAGTGGSDRPDRARRRRRRRREYDPDAPLREPAPLADALAVLAARGGWQARLDGARIHERWPEIAGEQLARHAQPLRLHGGVLVLRVADPGWATQVRYLSGALVAQANAVLGAGQVRQVTVVLGRGLPGEHGGAS